MTNQSMNDFIIMLPPFLWSCLLPSLPRECLNARTRDERGDNRPAPITQNRDPVYNIYPSERGEIIIIMINTLIGSVSESNAIY